MVRKGLQRLPARASQSRPDFLRLAGGGGTEEGVERWTLEPRFDLVMQRIEVESPGLVVARQVDVVPDPIDIDGGINAVVLQ